MKTVLRLRPSNWGGVFLLNRQFEYNIVLFNRTFYGNYTVDSEALSV